MTAYIDTCPRCWAGQALEYQLQQGGAEAAREDWALVPQLDGARRYRAPVQATGGVLRLLLPAVL